jgi:Kef-type K+ transport system membrane component KefB
LNGGAPLADETPGATIAGLSPTSLGRVHVEVSAFRSISVYILVVSLFAIASWLVLDYGKSLPAAGSRPPVSSKPADGSAGLRTLLLQIALTLAAARSFGWVIRKMGQPSVIGEILAGIVLGPTIFGRVAAGASSFIFPSASLGTLKLLAEVGVILFMFRVGLEVDLTTLRGRGHIALMVSHASIVIPFFLGVALALSLFHDFAPAGTRFLAFALFVGIAMSITAFPVLAHILSERGLSSTPLGTLALTCAAVDDITAWSLLAAVIAIVKAQSLAGALITVALVAVFAVVMTRIVRPMLARVGTPIGAVVILIFAAAAATELIGVHSVFGAFVAGAILPIDRERRDAMMAKLSLATMALLPLFFAYTGLRTDLALLGNSRGWLVMVEVIAVATIGKLGGSAIAARLSGMPWTEALSLGALMNTRGLMELIVLNIGYDLGILTPAMFATMVVMALVTTMATGPLLSATERWLEEHPVLRPADSVTH